MPSWQGTVMSPQPWHSLTNNVFNVLKVAFAQRNFPQLS
jgi:hypothetical protein